MEGDNNKINLWSRSIEVEITLENNEILRSNQQLVCQTFLGNKRSHKEWKTCGVQIELKCWKLELKCAFKNQIVLNVEYCLENMN